MSYYTGTQAAADKSARRQRKHVQQRVDLAGLFHGLGAVGRGFLDMRNNQKVASQNQALAKGLQGLLGHGGQGQPMPQMQQPPMQQPQMPPMQQPAVPQVPPGGTQWIRPGVAPAVPPGTHSSTWITPSGSPHPNLPSSSMPQQMPSQAPMPQQMMPQPQQTPTGPNLGAMGGQNALQYMQLANQIRGDQAAAREKRKEAALAKKDDETMQAALFSLQQSPDPWSRLERIVAHPEMAGRREEFMKGAKEWLESQGDDQASVQKRRASAETFLRDNQRRDGILDLKRASGGGALEELEKANNLLQLEIIDQDTFEDIKAGLITNIETGAPVDTQLTQQMQMLVTKGIRDHAVERLRALNTQRNKYARSALPTKAFKRAQAAIQDPTAENFVEMVKEIDGIKDSRYADAFDDIAGSYGYSEEDLETNPALMAELAADPDVMAEIAGAFFSTDDR